MDSDVSVWLALVNRNFAPQAMEQNLPITSLSRLMGYRYSTLFFSNCRGRDKVVVDRKIAHLDAGGVDDVFR